MQRDDVDVAVEIVDPTAASADHVLVRLDTRVVQSGAGAGINATGQAELHQELERRVDRWGGGPR